MPKRSNKFQRLIRLINATLIEHGEVLESEEIPDKTNSTKREVDILVRMKGPYPIVIAIEVTKRKTTKKVGETWVEQQRGRFLDLKVDKLILVSATGFTQSALEKARFHNIETITIEQALATDWALVANLASSGFIETTSLKYRCEVHCQSPNDGSLAGIVIAPPSVRLPLEQTAETPWITPDELVQRARQEKEFDSHVESRIAAGESHFWYDYTPPQWPLLVDVWDQQMLATKIHVAFEVHQKRTPIELASGSYHGHTFISGASKESNMLEFVLMKQEDGSVVGRLLDSKGIHSLYTRDRLDNAR